MNTAVDANQFYLLQRRNQNFTLGLLAIEQLTGPVKAGQAALSTRAGAGTGSDDNADKESTALEAAQTAANEAKAALAKADLAVEKARTELNDQVRKEQVAYATYSNLNNANPKDQQKVDDAKKAREGEQTATQTKKNDLATLIIERNRASGAKDIADARATDAQETLMLAKGRVRAAASGNAAIAAAGGRGVVITDRIAAAVENIVNSVLLESGRGEECNALINQFLDNKTKELADALTQICPPTQVKQVAKVLDDAGRKGDATLLRQLVR